jgi:hypothetical protein
MTPSRARTRGLYYLTAGSVATVLVAALWQWSPPIAIIAGVILAVSAGIATDKIVRRPE